jgi:hypothetical protein
MLGSTFVGVLSGIWEEGLILQKARAFSWDFYSPNFGKRYSDIQGT